MAVKRCRCQLGKRMSRRRLWWVTVDGVAVEEGWEVGTKKELVGRCWWIHLGVSFATRNVLGHHCPGLDHRTDPVGRMDCCPSLHERRCEALRPVAMRQGYVKNEL